MKRVHQLSKQEVQALETLHWQTNDADVRSRCQMILLSDEGLSPPRIAQRVRFSRETVVRWFSATRLKAWRARLPNPVRGDHDA